MPHPLLESVSWAGGAPLDAEVLSGRAVFPEGVRAAVFDVVGTLIEPSPTVPDAYAIVAERHGLNVSADLLASRFADAWKRQETIDARAEPAHATSRSREWERWRGVVGDVFAGLADDATTERVFEDLWQHFALPTAWKATECGPALVTAALSAGLEIALASNFDERLFEVAAVVEPLVHATHVFPSSELGWRKPAAAFFQAVESRLGMQPCELVMFGDHPELDVAAARRAGWHSVLLPAD